MYFLKLFILATTLVFATACHYRINKQIENPGSEGAQNVAAPLDFSFVMKEVIGPRCLECHSEAAGNRGDVNLETYPNVKELVVGKPGFMKLWDSVVDDYMPKNRSALSAAQKDILKNWIAADAKEFASADPPVPEPVSSALDWLTVRTLVIEPKCLGCHSGANPRAGVSLESYQQAFFSIQAIQRTVSDGSMPRRTALTPEQKKLILDWIQIGAPEFVAPNHKEVL